MGLSGRIAIVTGSARGIGRAIALKLAEIGSTVVINDVGGIQSVENVAEEIRAMNRQSIAVIADVSSTTDVTRLVETAIATYGKIDILVNNAGITRDQLLIRMSDEDWDNVLNVNLRSAFLCTRAVLRHMIKQRWGRIVSMASIVGIMGNAGQANYASSKAGVIGFTRSIAKEVASRGITVNAIAPGFIETAMTQKLDEKQKQELKQRIPAGYFGSPRDVAEAVAFLVSEEARYIRGGWWYGGRLIMNSIDSYYFGQIVINGKQYSSDVIIFPDKVQNDWRRDKSHELSLKDITAVIAESREGLLIGTGASGQMKILPEVPEALKVRNIELIVEPTGGACEIYNRLSPFQKVVATLHLTC